jgi:hypothetical protein
MTFDMRQLNPQAPKPLSQLKVRIWLLEHNLSQRKLAQRLGRNSNLVGRVLRGQVRSAPIWSEIHRFMLNPDGYRPTKRRRTILGAKLKVGKNSRGAA